MNILVDDQPLHSRMTELLDTSHILGKGIANKESLTIITALHQEQHEKMKELYAHIEKNYIPKK